MFAQAHWRGRQVRLSVAHQHKAALTLQKHWRAARLRRIFHADVARIVIAQAAVRRSACHPLVTMIDGSSKEQP